MKQRKSLFGSLYRQSSSALETYRQHSPDSYELPKQSRQPMHRHVARRHGRQVAQPDEPPSVWHPREPTARPTRGPKSVRVRPQRPQISRRTPPRQPVLSSNASAPLSRFISCCVRMTLSACAPTIPTALPVRLPSMSCMSKETFPVPPSGTVHPIAVHAHGEVEPHRLSLAQSTLVHDEEPQGSY